MPEDKPAARGPAVPHRLRRPAIPHPRSADCRRRLSNLQAGTAGQIYYLKTVDGKSALNRYDLTTRKNETLLPDVSDYVVSADGKKLLYAQRQQRGRLSRRRRTIQPAEGRLNVDGDRSARRSARRVEADLRRGVADQPRLLLRPEHARRRLGAAAREVRGVPAARGDASRPQSRAAVDVERAVGRTPQRRRRRRARRAEDGSRRPARRRLRDRQRPLSPQEGLRRPELEPAAARAAHRARRQREDRRVPARRQRQGPASAGQRLQPVREHLRQDRRDHARSERRRHGIADRAGRAGRQRSGAAQPRLGRRQSEEGRQGDRRPRGLRLRAEHRRLRDTPTSSATSTRRSTRTPSSSTSASTAAAASPTTTSTSCAVRSSPTGRCATAPTSRRRSPRSRVRRR